MRATNSDQKAKYRVVAVIGIDKYRDHTELRVEKQNNASVKIYVFF